MIHLLKDIKGKTIITREMLNNKDITTIYKREFNNKLREEEIIGGIKFRWKFERQSDTHYDLNKEDIDKIIRHIKLK